MKTATITPASSKPTKSAKNSSPPTDQGHHRRKPKPKETLKQSQADKRIDFLLRQHFDDDPDFRPLILKLAEHDPTPKKKYLAWLVKHWTGPWNPSDADLKRVARHLETHHKGAKYFSPLSWTGLRLEDAGYHADIFRYTPQTLAKLGGRIAEIIRIDEEDKQIRKGNLVITGGAEIAYKDERWTVLRVRTQSALNRLGQGCGWCVCGRGGHGYSFPFDFVLSSDGERFLAHKGEIRDRWDNSPTANLYYEIFRVVNLGSDGYDRAVAQVEEAIKTKQRHTAEIENQLMQHPDLAIWYAEKVIQGRWQEFEEFVRVATLPAGHAADYAIYCLREPWPRFENKIKRSVVPLAQYRRAFPGAIPKTDEEIFQENLAHWRAYTAKARRPWSHDSIQWQAESRERNVDFENRLLLNYSEASIKRFAKLVASLATSEIASEYRSKIQSYFTEATDEKTQVVNDELGPVICGRICRRLPEVEALIADDPESSFAYAKGISQRFLDGEAAIRTEPELWCQYTKKFLRSTPIPRQQSNHSPRVLPPRTYKVAWR
ncbi:hypothetical protein [Novipirellula aureliae]|uniref:hypothetical protein n=1 Tax=Novipirellula aureliae TaxID=2527966 RepID=UPI0011B5B446|nr:hypothetical protein [Novipirellula aureliae]